MKKYLIVLLFVMLIFPSFSQEKLSDLNINVKVKNYCLNNSIKNNNKAVKSSLDLPFFDDFSDSQIYPKSTLWQDNYVYINSTLAPEPPSIGVATFDAVDNTGAIYQHAYYNETFVADTLTSQSINLNYPSDNTIFLSFYFRPGGIGNAPEPQDSLILEFYAPDEDKWNTVWAKEGSEDKDFELVMLHINDVKFLKDGFKFRFKNIASFGSSIYPALASNCDYWHIDYVYLNTGRSESDTDFNDIAFTKPLHSLLKNYESIPWEHYKNIVNTELKDELSIEFYNNDESSGRIIDSLNFFLTDLSGNTPIQKYLGGTFAFLDPLEIYPKDFSNHSFSFPINNDSECNFKFEANIVTNDFDFKPNNTISYTQKFKDYYAYDDGTAEAGYGIYGNGTKYGSVAYKFEPVANGYLKGVEIYFTQSYNNESQNYFWLNVWNEKQGGIPDTVIFSVEGQRPEYENELNKFHFYEFEESIPISNNFFVGWTQTTDEMLNVGFDFNNIANDKVYYNIFGSWEQSIIPGAIMIRPVFENTTFKNIDKEASTDNKIQVLPSIANANIKIDFNYKPNTNYSLKIFNMQGICIYENPQYKNTNINVSSFKKGMYLVNITSSSNNTQIGRFIVK